ncbi:MAG TPA: MDR family MFS transporter [Candidatus Lumbricidophila sp.]|nr:MDR family MFS transporter [Candidatus Lumbricidophila sp.]
MTTPDAPEVLTDRPVTQPDAIDDGERPTDSHQLGSQVRERTAAENSRVIWLLLAATFVVFLNETIMSVAIPHLVTDLHISLSAAQWLTTAFMLTMATVIPVTGFLLQRVATKPVFITAMSLFSAGTLIAAIAPGFEVLLVARVVQATGTAIMLPLLMTTLMTLVAPSDRGRVMGRVTIVMSVAPAIGPAISGVILTLLSWRFMFWLVLPIALVMLLIGARNVENVGETRKAPLDVVSVVLAAIGFGGLVYGLSLVGGVVGGQSATDAPAMTVSLTVGVLVIAIFVWRQLRLQRRDRALLDLRTFHNRNFAVSVLLMVAAMAALFGTIIVLPIYLQNVLGLGADQTGLLVLPGGLVMGLLGPTVGRLFDRVGPFPLLVPSSIAVSGVLWWFTTVSEHTSPWLVLTAHVVLSASLAFMFTPLFTAAMGSVQPHLYSHGSAMLGTVQQVAGAVGTAAFITVLAARISAETAAGSSAVQAEAAGVRGAFVVGAIISLGAIAGAFFVRRPTETGDEGMHGGH